MGEERFKGRRVGVYIVQSIFPRRAADCLYERYAERGVW